MTPTGEGPMRTKGFVAEPVAWQMLALPSGTVVVVTCSVVVVTGIVVVVTGMVVVVTGTVVVVTAQPVWAGFVRAMPLFPSHS
jgi:hypothetical protein